MCVKRRFKIKKTQQNKKDLTCCCWCTRKRGCYTNTGLCVGVVTSTSGVGGGGLEGFLLVVVRSPHKRAAHGIYGAIYLVCSSGSYGTTTQSRRVLGLCRNNGDNQWHALLATWFFSHGRGRVLQSAADEIVIFVVFYVQQQQSQYRSRFTRYTILYTQLAVCWWLFLTTYMMAWRLLAELCVTMDNQVQKDKDTFTYGKREEK